MALSSGAVVVYPEQGLLLCTMYGVTLALMLYAGVRMRGMRTIAGAVLVAVAAGPLLWLVGTRYAFSAPALEFSMLGVLVVAAMGMGLHRSTRPGRWPRAGTHERTSSHA